MSPLIGLHLVSNTTLEPQLENTHEMPQSSRDEGLLLLYGLESNPAEVKNCGWEIPTQPSDPESTRDGGQGPFFPGPL